MKKITRSIALVAVAFALASCQAIVSDIYQDTGVCASEFGITGYGDKRDLNSKGSLGEGFFGVDTRNSGDVAGGGGAATLTFDLTGNRCNGLVRRLEAAERRRR